jgi:hypothetical protein
MYIVVSVEASILPQSLLRRLVEPSAMASLACLTRGCSSISSAAVALTQICGAQFDGLSGLPHQRDVYRRLSCRISSDAVAGTQTCRAEFEGLSGRPQEWLPNVTSIIVSVEASVWAQSLVHRPTEPNSKASLACLTRGCSMWYLSSSQLKHQFSRSRSDADLRSPIRRLLWPASLKAAQLDVCCRLG